MRPCHSDAARAALRAYRGADRRTRIHAVLRQWIAPLDEIERLVPVDGEILDLGCGNGVFTLQLLLAGPERRLHAVDLSAYKVEQARRAAMAADVADRASFEVVGSDWRPELGRYDAVLISDVLYLLDPASVIATTGAACDALASGGLAIIKEVATTPRWKHLVGLAQEVVMVRIVRITRGATINSDPLASVVDALQLRGWGYDELALDRGYYYAHRAVLARRPADQ